MSSSFDLAKSLAGAKNLVDMVELQAAHWHKQLGALTADAAAPIKAHMARGADGLGTTH